MVCKVRAWSMFRASGSLVYFAWLLAASCRNHQYCVQALFVVLGMDTTYCDKVIGILLKYS